ncbi:MAG: hypothetical protein WCC53_13235 [Thermoanaerobaculia bacterium]|jgi:hypothetical protein
MFRTARGFLLVLPAAFVLVLVAYLVAHPNASDSFVAYPFLAESLGSALGKRPLVRFVMASAAFFVPPYLVTGLLLFIADAGVSAAAPLWSSRRRRVDGDPPPESRWAFVGVSLAAALVSGVQLHRIAHGGEFPGGVNVSPLFVVLAAFAAVGTGLFAAGAVALPRAVARRLGASV